jgi:DNA gyrase subunit A
VSQNVTIEHEIQKSYLEYSLSVIVGRAIPDVRDGLKPVHRRILFAMHELSNSYNRPYKKSARVVGDVIGKYHPHGDSAVYDAIVRMAQDFSMRDMLVDGQGNFGSIDGDAAAAMRYTEVRMSKLASEFLGDIEKKTVDFRPNYDNTLEEPVVLPAKVPNLLLNGSSGIAVGMATNIPPHNLGELIDATVHVLDNPGCHARELLPMVKGPDFPTGGAVYAGRGLADAYLTGRGSIRMRGIVSVEEAKRGGKENVIITEIPFALNKSSLVEKIAQLVNDKKIDGVADLRDESDRKGIRIVLELKRGAIADIVINALYKFTPLESSFGINMMAVVGNRPRLLNLKQILVHFLEHRREVVIRRTRFDLDKSEARAHILEGLKIAIDNIDEVVALIRASKTVLEAKAGLMERFALTDIQAQAILDMRLQRLTNMERQKLIDELAELMKLITWLKSILDDENILRGVIRDELTAVRKDYATPRKTQVLAEEASDIAIEDLIPDDEAVITLSRRGYIKRTSLSHYQQQKRGGKGIAGVATNDGDFVHTFLLTSNHQYLLFFTNQGRMLQLKAHQVPEAGRYAKGAHINNLLPLEKDEFVATAITLREFADDRQFLFVTRRGMVKRTLASLYANSRSTGIRAVSLKPDDELMMVCDVQEEADVLLITEHGTAIRFPVSEVRPMGRVAAGVKGIALRGKDRVVAGVVTGDPDRMQVLTVSELGYGKRTPLDQYRVQSRGGKGIINMRVTDKTGKVVGAVMVAETDQMVVLSSLNKIVRFPVKQVSLNLGRATQGVRLVNVGEGGVVAGFDLVQRQGLDPVEGLDVADLEPLGQEPETGGE